MNKMVNIDKVFRDKLAGLEENPPAYLWNNLQERMTLRRRKIRKVIYRWTAAAALLALALVSGWYFDIISYNRNPQIAGTEKVQKRENAIIAEKFAGEDIATEGPALKEETPGSQYTAAISPGSGIDRVTGDITEHESDIVHTPVEIATGRQSSGTLALSERGITMKKIKALKMRTLKEKYPLTLADKGATKKSDQKQVQKREMIAVNDIPEEYIIKPEKSWKMGIQISPGYSSYSSSHDPAYAGKMTYPSSQANANVCGGVSVQYKTGRKWGIESGIYYARNGQKSESTPQLFASYSDDEIFPASQEKLYFNPEVDVDETRMAMRSVAGIIEFDEMPEGTEIAGTLERTAGNSNALLTRGEFAQVFDFLEIPLYLRYLLVNSKLDVELVGGVSAGVIVGNNAFLNNEYGMQRIGKTRDISTFNVSGTLGIGIDYTLSKHISLALEPRINYYMNSINNNPDVEFRPYRVGIYTGLYYEF